MIFNLSKLKNKLWFFYGKLSLFIFSSLFPILSFADDTDMLASVKEAANTNFGATSSFYFLLIGADLLVSFIVYMKSKNLTTFIGTFAAIFLFSSGIKYLVFS